MKERPILFSAPMVRAILEGRKTQTRRIIKEQPLPGCIGTYGVGIPFIRGKNGDVRCPYGQPGDRLWVRETWQGPVLDEEALEQSRRDGTDAFKKPEFCVYRSTDTLDAVDEDGNDLGWKPSIHMPRWASRITLEVTGVRVERLQEIGEVDARAEGAPWAACGSPRVGSHKAGFAQLWESINGAGSWGANPWVWVIEFEAVK